MLVNLVVPAIDSRSGGLGRNVPRLARALREEGLSVELAAVGRSADASGREPGTFLGKPAWPRVLGRSPELRRHLYETPLHLIHANGLWMAPLGYAANAATRRGVPFVVSPRGMLSPWALRRSWWKKTLARWLVHRGAFARVSGWHVTSAEEENDVRRLGFDQPTCLAPNGVDPPADNPAEVRLAYESAAPAIVGKRVLLFYSRFHSKKRVAELIDTFAAAARRLANWHLLVVGIPEELSVEQLRMRAAALGASQCVSVLDGRVLPKPYSLSQVMALPTHDENFGQVIAEALASGVPVITTTGTPWQDLNTHEAGRWVPISEFPRALSDVLACSPGELKAAGDRGRSFVLSQFSWRASAKTLKGFYESLSDLPR